MNYNKLKEIIISKGLTLPKLAEKIGVDKTNIYRTFSNESLTVDKLEDICRVLEIPISILFENEKGLNVYSDEINSLGKALEESINLNEQIISDNKVYQEKLTELNNKAKENKEVILGIEDYVNEKYSNLSDQEKFEKIFDVLTKFELFKALWPLKDTIESKHLKTILAFISSESEISELESYVLYRKKINDPEIKENVKFLKQKAKADAWKKFNDEVTDQDKE